MLGKQKVKLTFLGVGGANQLDLGHASAVLEMSQQRLLIDCGPGTIKAFRQKYDALPDALFITHCHLDHIADFESLFIQSWFGDRHRKTPKIYVPAKIVALLNMRVASYPSVLAEGGVNFWEAFQLIPVIDKFIFAGKYFHVMPVRHHHPDTAYGVQLPHAFFYTGDTRPIPEVLNSLENDEQIFHDCAVVGNPSHTGIDDVKREYSEDIIRRLHCYHYTSSKDQPEYARAGLSVVKQGQSFEYELGPGA